MGAGLVGLYALYFIAVGVSGNAPTLWSDSKSDFKGFLPWILALIILRALYSSATLRPLVKPFIGLAALVFFLRNYETVAGQLNQLLPATAQLKTTGNTAAQQEIAT